MDLIAKLQKRLLSATLQIPLAMRSRLIGPPPSNDRGEALDPALTWLVAVEARLSPALSSRNPIAARASLLRGALSVEGPLASVPMRPLLVAGRDAVAYGEDTGAPTFVFLHGGGWVSGDLRSHQRLCARLAQRTGCTVLALDYPRAPEAPFPAALDYVLAALAELRSLSLVDHPSFILGGDSAGGNLTAAACLALRDQGRPLPCLQVLLYPAVDLRRQTASMQTFAEGFLLTRASIDWYLEQYAPPNLLDPLASPLLATSHAGLPPAILQNAGFDPLRDEGDHYVTALRAAGVSVQHLYEPSMLHGFANMDGAIPGADAAIARLERAICAHLAPKA